MFYIVSARGNPSRQTPSQADNGDGDGVRCCNSFFATSLKYRLIVERVREYAKKTINQSTCHPCHIDGEKYNVEDSLGRPKFGLNRT